MVKFWSVSGAPLRGCLTRDAARAAVSLVRAPTLLLVLAALSAACGTDADGASSEGASAADAAPLPPPVIAPLAAPYRSTGAAIEAGVVAGTVRIAGDVPQDTTVRPVRDPGVCGTSFVDETIRVRGDSLRDAVVWLVGVEAGKPIPLSKRYELTARRCRLEPRVQAVLAGGTVNVKSADALTHETRLLDHRTGETLALVQHNDFGQLVPVQTPFERGRLIEVRSDTYGWMRGWIAVFDHPYFAVTSANGTFEIPDVPAGRYELRAWHERFGLAVDTVSVTTDGRATVSLQLRAAAGGTGSAEGNADR